VKPLRYDPEAEGEYFEAVRWYHERNPIVAIRFVQRVLECEGRIREHPRRWPNVEDVSRRLDVRRNAVENFPYPWCTSSLRVSFLSSRWRTDAADPVIGATGQVERERCRRECPSRRLIPTPDQPEPLPRNRPKVDASNFLAA
jgi:hypothetical protein